MQIRYVSEKQKSAFNKAAAHPLQSWEWGEFRKKSGNEAIRLGIYKDNKLTGSIQIMVHKIPGANLKIGTLIKGPTPSIFLINKLKEVANKNNLIFIKIEPFSIKTNQKKNEKIINVLKNNGCLPGKTLFTPTSFWIDLTKSEDELLKSFSSKTRYNIRLSERKGVKVSEDNSKKAFDRYLYLTGATVKRQGFYAHTQKYHKLMWKVLNEDMVQRGKSPIARLLTAKYKGEIITTWIIFVWKDFLYYPYGASSEKHKNVMANNAIMWEAIRYGKNRKLKTFDLWGREPGKGFTRFKEGYNPKVVEFFGTWDLVTSPLYYPYRVVEKLRWIILKGRTKFGFSKPRF